jgi:4-amino-4-deoxy-L-arabinose transferase-like glycosyltransferase
MRKSFDRAKRWLSRDTAILLLLLLIAAFFRFYRIDQFPPGLQFDEAYYLFDTLRLVQGQFSLFFTANNGREPLYMYLSTVGVALFGPQELGMRVVSAFIGTITVGLTFGFVRTLFHSTRVAALTAFFAAISIWHIFNSRSGQRVILVVPLTVLTLWWFWLAVDAVNLEKGNERARRGFAFAGLSAALTAYTYLSGRLLPFILIALAIFAILLNRARTRELIVGLALTGITALVVFLPLGLYFAIHPEDLTSHAANLSILDSRVNNGDILSALFRNLTAVAGMFLVQGDHLGFRNVYNRPVFDPVSGAFFLLGLVLLVAALLAPSSSARVRLRSLLIVTCLGVFLAVSVFSDDPPNFGRTLVAVPFAMILPGWGAAAIWERFRVGKARPWVAGAIGLCLAAAATSSFYDYFIGFAQSPATYYALDVDRFDAANWINENGNQNTIFLAPLWYQHGTVAFITRNTPLRSFESRDTVVLPSNTAGKDALYAFPLEQEQKGINFATRLGSLVSSQAVTGTNGAKILQVYRVPFRNLPDPADPLGVLARGGVFVQPQTIKRANWADRMELLGYTVSPEGPGGRNLTATLFLRGLGPMQQDYTFSVKVRDDKGRVWGQEDKWPGDNSYATTQWNTGDLVIEKFYPGLAPCAPPGEYSATVEAYNPTNMQVLPLSASEDTRVVLGTMTAGASESNRLEDLEPEQNLPPAVAEKLGLFGLTLSSQDVQVNSLFSLSLFWRGSGNGSASRTATVHLVDASKREFVLAEKDFRAPAEGRGICTLFDLAAPPDLAPGPGSIVVNGTTIATLNFVR